MSLEPGVPVTESEMEVDAPTKELTNFAGHIVDSNPGSPQKSPKDRLVELLDQVETHVDRLRRDALKLEEDRDTLLTTIDTLRNSEMIVDLTESKSCDITSKKLTPLDFGFIAYYKCLECDCRPQMY